MGGRFNEGVIVEDDDLAPVIPPTLDAHLDYMCSAVVPASASVKVGEIVLP